MRGKDYLDHLKKINDVFYDQIKIADQKAAYIFTFMLAFLITSSEGRATFQWQRYVDAQFPLVIFSAMMAVAASISLICTGGENSASSCSPMRSRRRRSSSTALLLKPNS